MTTNLHVDLRFKIYSGQCREISLPPLTRRHSAAGVRAVTGGEPGQGHGRRLQARPRQQEQMLHPPRHRRPEHRLVSGAGQRQLNNNYTNEYHNPGPSISAGGGCTATGTCGWSRPSGATCPWRRAPAPASPPPSPPSRGAPGASGARLAPDVCCARDPSSCCSSVKPDFLLVRQNLRDANENYKKLLLGFR